MRLRSAHWTLAFTFLILGVAVAVQWRVEGRSGAVATSNGLDGLGGLAGMVNRTERQNAQLTAEVSRLRLEVSARARRADLDRELQAELVQARAEAGLTPVQGAGVQVVLANPVGVTGGASVIHDTDVLTILNELRASGATALAINGQRVVATTEVRQAGSIFSINNRPAAPPFTILALGPPGTMASALQLRGGAVETLMALGIQVEIEPEGHLTLPAYTGPVND